MKQQLLSPDYLFETSWEVCNKVGGIYTVLSTHAKTLQTQLHDHLVFIGPDLKNADAPFAEDKALMPAWREALRADGLVVRIGRWTVPGEPIAILVDFTPLFEEKDAIYAQAWDRFGVDSLRGYGDYDEASMFSVAAGRVAESIVRRCLKKPRSGSAIGGQETAAPTCATAECGYAVIGGQETAAPTCAAPTCVVYHAHEWMSGMGMMFLKDALPEVATVFTTHATSIGRSIAGNNKLLYQYFEGYNGDQMAAELSMEAKHSVEKQSAHHADCFTTVSQFTARECTQLLDKTPDVVLPNGFELDFVPKAAAFTAKRRAARRQIINVATALTGDVIPSDVLIVSTSGRNDFRCKGFDVYLESLAQLNARLKSKQSALPGLAVPTRVLALIEVPCWLLGPRADLQEKLGYNRRAGDRRPVTLPTPMITHDLHNLNEDRILCMMKQLGLCNAAADAVKVMLVPTYLEGHDGIFNMPYYDLLTANDLCIYPSYYEPWGYTPLESCAFKTPCITTDLSGFGQWVDEELGHAGQLEDGVCVLHRDDTNYFEAAREISLCVEHFLALPEKERTAARRAAARLAAKAQWKNFIPRYYEAYDLALKKTMNNE